MVAEAVQAPGPETILRVLEDERPPPPTSYQTSSARLRAQLIIYDRERDLWPLLSIHAVRDINNSSTATNSSNKGTGDEVDGVDLTYDFEAIESVLQRRLLGNGAARIALQVHMHTFAGELGARGELRQLAQRVRQEALSPPVLEQIQQELDSNAKVAALQAQLEDATRALATFGGNASIELDATRSLRSFCVEALRVDPSTFDKLASPTVSGEVQLRHLQSLMLALEGSDPSSWTDDIASPYTEPLTPDTHEADLGAAVPFLDLDRLLPALRDFSREQLGEARWPADESLKDYLGFMGVDSSEVPGFDEHFPSSLTLAHTKTAYLWLLSQSVRS